MPVFYGGEHGPDLAELAARQGLTPEEVVRIHSGQLYTVYMLGFSPGFPYMGVVPASIAAPRLPTPRTSVPAGSVGIAGRQTGIYPQATPGGWRLIGRTDLALFDPQRDPPAHFAPGDRVRFVPVEARDRRPALHQVGAPVAPSHLAPAGSVEVVSPGLLSTVQDLGRHGYQRYGVPVCGPVDEFALRAANALAGNPSGAAGLELTVAGPVLRFHADAVLALTGADLGWRLHSVDLGAWDVPLWTALFVRAGSLLECRGGRSGCRGYLALAGGILTPPVLGSQATCLVGGFGGYEGRALAGGDRLAIGPVAPGRSQLAGRVLPAGARPAYTEHPTVRVVPGPQTGFFDDAALQTMLTQPYQVSPTSDRTGLRLAGPPLDRAGARSGAPAGAEMISMRDGAGRNPGAGWGPTDSAPGRPPDGWRLPSHRHRDPGGSTPARPMPARGPAQSDSRPSQWKRRSGSGAREQAAWEPDEGNWMDR